MLRKSCALQQQQNLVGQLTVSGLRSSLPDRTVRHRHLPAVESPGADFVFLADRLNTPTLRGKNLRYQPVSELVAVHVISMSSSDFYKVFSTSMFTQGDRVGVILPLILCGLSLHGGRSGERYIGILLPLPLKLLNNSALPLRGTVHYRAVLVRVAQSCSERGIAR
jgi:hypothetical protein